MIISSAHRTFTVKRMTAFVLDAATASATMSLTRQPVRESMLQVRVYNGTTNTGTVTLTGLDISGGAVSEVLTFTTIGYKQSVNLYASVNVGGVTTSGLTDEATVPTMEIKSLGADGSLQNASFNVVVGWPMYMDRSRPSRAVWKAERSGTAEEEPVFVMIQWSDTWAPREGDILIDNYSAEQFVITGTPMLEGYNRVSHYEAWAQRRQGSVS
jgi:hypothetical protein